MKIKTIASWVVAVLLALAFLGAGFTKLSSQPMMVTEFTAFGLPMWFMYVTGVIEVVSAVLVLIPRLSGIGAALLVCVMVGALVAHISHGQAAMIGVPVVLLVLAIVLGTLRGWSRPGTLRGAVA
jgi:putative oxidoreductase